MHPNLPTRLGFCRPSLGDELLCKVKARLEALLPPGDFLARGGDEFLLFLHDRDRSPSLIKTVKSDIDSALKEERVKAGICIDPGCFCRPPDRAFLTVSVGFSQLRTGPSSSVRALQDAWTACTQAKRDGRDRIVVALGDA